MSEPIPSDLPLPLSTELESSLERAVVRLREKVDAVYENSDESEKMADLHYLAQELISQHLAEMVSHDPELEPSAMPDLHEQVARRVHRMIETTRRT